MKQADEKISVDTIRHSTAHLLAMAVQDLWPKTQVTIGPVVENGFFYDFSFPEGIKITDAELETIEKKMQELAKKNLLVKRVEVTREEAIDTFTKLGEHFKVELVKAIPEGEVISIYYMGDWFDLCTGPHVPSTKYLNAFKLTSIAGSYWRGDEKNPRLTRIYGTAWENKKDLDDYLHRLEEAKKRDHRVLGKQLDLFGFHHESPASPFFHAKGQFLFQVLQALVRRSNRKFGFQEVGTPIIFDTELWKKSGHWDFFKQNMYFTKVDEMDSAVKPMNCPGHCLIFGSTRRSYRELPVRYSEFGRVHRHERSGVTHGLLRVRSFTQDDAHVFCTQEQIGEEVGRLLQQIDEIYTALGFTEVKLALALKPDEAMGDAAVWEMAENTLRDALRAAGKEFKELPKEGAFYGPKIEFHLVDAIGRSWQCGTIQLDFSMPKRFDLNFIGSEDKPIHPVMIHRACLGSLERFIGVFVEHYAGHFPLWAAPTQAILINISEKQIEFTKDIFEKLNAQGVRVEMDLRKEKLGFKIREAQLAKIPYMLVIGDKEVEAGQIAPRFRDGKNLPPMSVEDFVAQVKTDCGEFFGLGM